MAGLAAASGPMLMALFGLLERLSEMECMVRVLQLVSVLVEVLGDQILPHLGIITRSLPQVRGSNPHASLLGHAGQPFCNRFVTPCLFGFSSSLSFFPFYFLLFYP